MNKARLAELLLEKQRRLINKRPEFIPNAGQAPIVASSKKERYAFSANGSGKTALLVNELQAAATGRTFGHPEIPVYRPGRPIKIVLILDNARKMEEVIIPEWRKWHDVPADTLTKEGKPYISKVTLPTATISVYSAESDPSVFEGFQADYLFIDEPLPKPLYVAAKRSLRIQGSPSRLYFAGTAVSQAWLKTEIWDKWAKGELPEVDCFRVGIDVNLANLGEGYKERFGATLSDAEREVRLSGGFFNAEGLALAHLWDREIHLVEPFEWPESWPVVVAIDNHTVKPHTAVMLGVDPDNQLYAIKLLRHRAPASQFAPLLREWMSGYKVLDIVCDSLGSTEMSSGDGFESFIEKLNECGVRARATRFEEKSHEDLIDRMRQVLVCDPKPRLRVFNTCEPLAIDIETVGWQRNRTTGEYAPKLATGTKDFLSCLGYALATGLTYDKVRKSKPYVLNRAPYRGLSTPTQRMVKSRIGRLLPRGFKR